MKCNLHYEREVVNFCNQCHAPLCIECNEKYGGLCRSCLSRWLKNEKVELSAFLIIWGIFLVVALYAGIVFCMETSESLLNKVQMVLILVVMLGFSPFGYYGIGKMLRNHILVLPAIAWLFLIGIIFCVGLAFGWLFAIPEIYSICKRYKNVKVFNKVFKEEKEQMRAYKKNK